MGPVATWWLVGCVAVLRSFPCDAAKMGKHSGHGKLDKVPATTDQDHVQPTSSLGRAAPPVDPFPAPQPQETRMVNITGVMQFYMMDIVDVHADPSMRPTRDHKAFGVLVSENDGRIALSIDPRKTKVKYGDIAKVTVRMQSEGHTTSGGARTRIFDTTAETSGAENSIIALARTAHTQDLPQEYHQASAGGAAVRAASEVLNIEVIGHVSGTRDGQLTRRRREARQKKLQQLPHRRSRRAPTLPNVTTEYRSAIFVLIHFSGDNATAKTYCNEKCIRDQFWHDRPTFVRRLMVESSYNAIDYLEEDSRIIEVTLPGRARDHVDCGMGDLADTAIVYIEQMDPDTQWWREYNHIIYYIPDEVPGCSFAGLAQVGCGGTCITWMRSSSASVLAHEMMHNLGMNHASTDRNNDNIQDEEYGDETDVVGGPWVLANSNAPHREQTGWLPFSAVRDLNKEGFPVMDHTCVERGGFKYRQGSSADYRGNKSVTVSGKTCQRWTAQTPHSHGMWDYALGSLSLGDHNYCRDPDGEDQIWCYTTDPDTRWDYCDDDCTNATSGSPTAAPTAPPTTPVPCDQQWNITLATLGHLPDGTYGDSAVRFKRSTGGYYYLSLRAGKGPHERAMASYLVDRVYVHYQLSRRDNTELVVWLEEGESWTERSMGWTLTFLRLGCDGHDNATISIDFCPRGSQQGAVAPVACAKAQGYHQTTINHTACGDPCVPWEEEEPEYGVSAAHNYCRHVGEDFAWCYTASSWDYCDICGDTTDCTFSHTRACACSTADPDAYYVGPVNETVEGIPCQAWDAQFPHSHSFDPESEPESHLTGNACRDPDGEGCPWCYTTDPDTRWDCCNICPRAEPVAFTEQWIAEVGSPPPTAAVTPSPTSPPSCSDACDPAGGPGTCSTHSTTICGYPCQAWASQEPHSHSYTPENYPEYDLSGNACRNPGESDIYAWCYTTDSSVRWQYCDICGGSTNCTVACPGLDRTEVDVTFPDIPLNQTGVKASKIAVTSCYHEGSTADAGLATIENANFDIMLELGDNVYSDSTDTCVQQTTYNAKKATASYASLITSGVKTMATWDDHDFCYNNQGATCGSFRTTSQQNFLKFYDINETDVRWTTQEGIYSARMFGSGSERLHIILLDARYHRSPTYASFGTCEGDASQMLSPEQWSWLETELAKPSAVKIIGSGIQVLPPLAPTHVTSKSQYCAYTGAAGNAFDAAIDEMDEVGLHGTTYESWSEIPQERAKLLRFVQRSLNAGNAGTIVFVSGDQHWGELSTKTIPASDTWGAAQTVHELTASGMAANWYSTSIMFYNDNRAHTSKADTQGNGIVDRDCIFPFRYNGISYDKCTMVDQNVPWCAIDVDESGDYVGEWGVCSSFVNSAPSNYGEIDIDFAAQQLALRIVTPSVTPAISGELNVTWSSGAPQGSCYRGNRRVQREGCSSV
eukprot:m.13349 g.13349  ORF g.13349 m.13349 type:complete len:1437 (+) comp10091_c0_seq3:247-4557(+)